jgi:hypothetical protein
MKLFNIELQKDTMFNENFVCTFIKKLLDMSEHKRQKEKLPSDSRLSKV